MGVRAVMRRLPGLCAAAILLAWCSQNASAQTRSPRTVLVLFWGTEDYPTNPVEDAAIRQALQSRSNGAIEYFAEYLESETLPAEEASLALRDYLDRKFRSRRIDLVIAITQASLQFALRFRQELFPDVPIVYRGAVAVDSSIRTAGSGLTGVVTENGFNETLSLALKLHPGTERVFVLAQWPDAAVEDAVRAGLSEFEKRVALTFVTDRSVPLLLSAIKGIPGRSLVLYIRAPAESPPLTPLPGEMARLVAEVSPVPVYSSSQASVGSGVVGGVTYHVRTLGTRVGELAATILDGARPQDIPIEHAALVPIVDWRQLQRWGIAEDALPPGSFVLFRDTSLWQQYRPYIITGAALLIAQTVLIAGLLFQRAKRRQAEADLRGSYERIRNLGGRLLSAQEAERAHLARELHDDVGQQMSILQMDLETLRCRRGESIQDNELLAEASERAATAAKSLRELSHRLHPANLRLLGLTTALQSLQRELSSSGVAIAFSHDDVPASLSQNVMMCFYRVAQEALSNAIKHAGADNVSICLRGDPGGLIMTIDDNGVGFDVRQVPRGLGLISMTERIEQLGGTLQIRSEIGGGTHLEASVSSAAGGAVAAGAP